MLSRLILAGDGGDRLTDEELRDQLVTLLLAGHETTATALAWALYELGRDPASCARAREAARDGDDDYLEAVLKESMRLHPVIPMVVRTLMQPATIGGLDLPAGRHRRPVDPARARPRGQPPRPRARSGPSGSSAQNPPVNTWIPFGGGVRRCIGAGFSLMEGVAVLREVLTAYDVDGASGRRPPEGPQHHQRAAPRAPGSGWTQPPGRVKIVTGWSIRVRHAVHPRHND